MLVGVLQGINGTMIFLVTILIWVMRTSNIKTAANLEKLKERKIVTLANVP